MKSSGSLYPLAPTWSGRGLILVLKNGNRKIVLIACAIVALAVMLGVRQPELLVAGLIFIAGAIFTIFRRPRTLRLNEDQLTLNTISVHRINLYAIDVISYPIYTSIVLHTSDASIQILVFEDYTTGLALGRLLRIWSTGKLSSTWGSPAFFEELQPTAIGREAIDVFEPFQPEISEHGLRLHFLLPNRRKIFGTTLIVLAAVIFLPICSFAPLSSLPGLEFPFGVELDPLSLLLLTPTPFLLLFGLALFSSPPTERIVELSSFGIRTDTFRAGYADLLKIELIWNGLRLTSSRGKITLNHHDNHALLELRERLVALRAHAQSGSKNADNQALRQLLEHRVANRSGETSRSG